MPRCRYTTEGMDQPRTAVVGYPWQSAALLQDQSVGKQQHFGFNLENRGLLQETMPHRILADPAAPALQYTVWLLFNHVARYYILHRCIYPGILCASTYMGRQCTSVIATRPEFTHSLNVIQSD